MKFPAYSKPFILWSSVFVLLITVITALLLLSKNVIRIEAVTETNRITISDEEFNFYLDIVRSGELNRELTPELKEKAMDYAKTVYAKLQLAGRYGVVDTYSFEKLKQGHREENEKRKKMKEEGQVFYGPEHLELGDYFEYFIDEMTMATISAMAEKESKPLVKESRAYYDEIKDLFSDETILFDLIKQSENGASDEIEHFELNNNNRRIFENTEPELLSLLDSLQAGDEAPYTRNNEPYIVAMKSRTKLDLAFDENKEQAIKMYVNDVHYVNEMNRAKDALEIRVPDQTPESSA
ncbi:hypothetical protein D3P08_12795 [Paenibacillus nanensis]|uniref:Uncharacterized protein n=1 Tax=Paenibacillus nanensis TaxID=393251 RepID=A0A3A1UVY5_9BACL|nr:hypothetical protein [Paenibacillus nanensis]RIX52355.1 hypothetical protein D3P08_12795 [Paenibacillus nanensis]